MKCTLVLPETSSPINLWSSPIISGSSHVVSCFWTFPQQGPFPDNPLGLWQGFWQLIPRVSAADQLPESQGRAAPGPQEILKGLVNADTMGGGGLASRNHCWHSLMEGRRKRKLALGFLLLPQNNWEKKGLSVKVGSHSNVPSAVSPRELMEKSVALPYLLKCLSSPPFLCSAFPISKWLKLLKLGPDRDPLTESSG